MLGSIATTSRRAVPAALLLLTLAACSAEPPPAATRPAPALAAPLRHRAPSGGLRADFSAQAGAEIASASGSGWRFRATPSGLGCDGALGPLGGATPERRGARVVFARPELDEWYERGPRGLEQGFTLHAPPACRKRGGRGVVLALGGGLRPAVAGGRREARLYDGDGHEAMRYADLRVVDAAGRGLAAWMEARGETLAIRFDDVGAVYPVVVDPTMWAEQQVLSAPAPDSGLVGQNFGGSVALSGDTAVVGAPFISSLGSAFVFERSGGAWTLDQQLVASDAVPGGQMGQAVAVSGAVALVGAPGQNGQLGEAYVFVQSGAGWTLAQTLQESSAGGFGSAVALDGDTALVAASQAGTVYVFVQSNGAWSLQQMLGGANADGGPILGFGASVALSGDTAVVGAPSAGIGGEAYVFVQSGGTWSLQQALAPASDMVGASFGYSVAVDGDTAVVGEQTLGAIDVFARTGTTWGAPQALAPYPPIDQFGWSVAVGGGNVAAAGLDGPMGGVYVFAPSGGSLAQTQTFSMAEGSFGVSLAMGGNTMLVGAPGASGGQGEAYVYVVGAGDGAACASADDCLSGYCTDGVCCTVASCPAAGPCNDAEQCQAGTGTCTVTPINTGQPCPSDACNSATCQDGACTSIPTECPPTDACHEFGVCDPTSGQCSNPQKPDGAVCPEGTCSSGVCTPSGAMADAGTAGSQASSGGCGCGVARTPAGGALGALLALAILARARGRRGRDSRPPDIGPAPSRNH